MNMLLLALVLGQTHVPKHHPYYHTRPALDEHVVLQESEDAAKERIRQEYLARRKAELEARRQARYQQRYRRPRSYGYAQGNAYRNTVAPAAVQQYSLHQLAIARYLSAFIPPSTCHPRRR